MSMKKNNLVVKVRSEEEKCRFSLLDLPDLALDCVLENLSPTDLWQQCAHLLEINVE